MTVYQEGLVTAVSEKTIWVEITRKSACGSDCAKCGALCAKQVLTVEAENVAHAKAGDRVLLEMPPQKILTAAFLVYIIPLAALLLGYALSNRIIKNDMISALFGLVFMAVSFLLLHIYDRKSAKKYRPVAISLINDELQKDS